MTFEEMKSEAELLYESINSNDAPGFLDTEWAQFFTIAQRKIVLRILKEGVTRNAFNQLAIEKLIQHDDYVSFTTNSHFKNSDESDSFTINTGIKAFNSDYFWILDEYMQTGAGPSLITNIPLKRITFDFYRLNKDNPFRVPDSDEGYWIIQYNNLPVFITDGVTPTGYYLVGVKHPDNYPIISGTVYDADNNASCLNVSVHPKIVEEAVTLARMSVVDAQGYQLALAEFAK